MDTKLLYALKQEIIKTIKNVYNNVDKTELKKIFEEIIQAKDKA